MNPAASRRCLVVRSPGSASASTSVQPWSRPPGHRRLHERRADAHAPGARLHVAALDQAADPSGHRLGQADGQEADHGPLVLPHQQVRSRGRVQRSRRVTVVVPPSRAAPPRMDRRPPGPGRAGGCRPAGPRPRPAGPAPSPLRAGCGRRPLVEQLAGPVQDGPPVAGGGLVALDGVRAPRGPGSRAGGPPGTHSACRSRPARRRRWPRRPDRAAAAGAGSTSTAWRSTPLSSVTSASARHRVVAVRPSTARRRRRGASATSDSCRCFWVTTKRPTTSALPSWSSSRWRPLAMSSGSSSTTDTATPTGSEDAHIEGPAQRVPRRYRPPSGVVLRHSPGRASSSCRPAGSGA